jgi:hypothetical protein
MASVAWYHERLDEMCARVSAEASSKADRIISEMGEFEEVPWNEQVSHFHRFGVWGPERRHYSSWEIRRIVFPRILSDLEAL